MKRYLVFVLIFMFSCSGTVWAADAKAPKPFVKEASIEVLPNQGGASVSEKITISQVEAVKDGKLEHLFTRFDGIDIKNLVIRSGQQDVKPEIQKGSTHDKVFITIPQGKSGDFAYEITFEYTSNEPNKIPLVIPGVASDGTANVVSLKLKVPEGQYLHESFPVIDSGETGMVEEHIMNIPNFLNVKFGDSPAGFFTTSNLYTLLGLVVILGIITAWLVSERKNKTGGFANV
ncbi:hypothetical protein [Aneurinibacillus tyrosinisolvens]|uniref:hypothetical protein n=1 Tax=Aneurinibacillus tyrosinisolvens TaxID=1443435 RepID=UPI00063F6157|nr:hypothetical protein [Aneurinibacillus tyrosinisolvens]